MIAIEFHETITLGSVVVGALVSALVVVSAIYGVRWKTTAQVNAANALAWEDTATRYEVELANMRERLEEQDRKIAVLQTRIAELEALPDVAAVHRALVEHDTRAAAAMDRHDENAERRADRIVQAFREHSHH